MADPDEAGPLLELIGAGWTAQVVHVAAELGLADLLVDGPRAGPDLAEATGSDPASLERLLDALTTLGLCVRHLDGRVGVTARGRLLADGEASLRPWALWWGRQLWSDWGGLLESVRTGRSARGRAQGTDDFGPLQADPARAELFNEALASLTRLEAPAVVAALDLAGTETVVDLGGGHGALLREVLRTHPGVRGVLADLDHALPGARRRMEADGLDGRCQLVACDVFASVPAGADAYVLKSVLHDWDDEAAGAVLGRCREAMGPDARLLLVERVVPERLDDSAASRSVARMDLTMLVAQGGRERRADDFRRLLDRSGLVLRAIRPATPSLSVLEAARPASPAP